MDLFIFLPIWCVNIIAGLLVVCTIPLVLPVRYLCHLRVVVFTVLLLLTALPLYAHISTERFNPENLLLVSYRLILGGIGIALCFRVLVGMHKAANLHALLNRFFLWVSSIRPRMFLVGSFTICLLVCSSISWHVFDGVPGFVDSCAYMFQARLFAHGMLSAPPPPEPKFFEVIHIILSDRWYTVYPPGYPAILALGVLLGIPWLVNPILAALTIVCIFRLAKELYGDSTAKLSAVLACASSFFCLCPQNSPHIPQPSFSSR